MIKLRHLYPSNSSRSESNTPKAFFLRNQTGDMLSLYTEPQTRYEGWFISAHDHFFKLIERITLVGENGDLPVTGLTNVGHTCFWEYDNGTRMAWKPVAATSGVTISLSNASKLRITLDMRHIYSFPSFGRSYQVTNDKTGTLVTYTDPELHAPLYLHIRSSEALMLTGEWRGQTYSRDELRHSDPTNLFVYDLATVTTDLLGLGGGWTAEEARDASLAAFKQKASPPAIGINYTHDTLLNEVAAAKVTTTQALRWLKTQKGIYAGLPWFHQVWTRDELIAALGFTHEEQRETIERYLGMPLLEGELPTFNDSHTTCADGVGWLCLLIHEYGVENLSDDAHNRLLHFLTTAKEQLAAHRMAGHGLIHSGHNATWMDTIGRTGYRLEIQCMYGLLLEILYELTGEESYEQERLRLLGKVKQQFWHDGYLKDGLADTSLRPNVFIAYLLQPDLLSNLAWQSCFDKALTALKTPWGGLASLDMSHPEFQPASTGENNVSYHNGDSWFFVNNLAGIAMLRFNQHYYGKTIVDILQSSTHETLWENMIGQPGEISSAYQLESFGCGIQAFSGGTYLALLKEFEDYSAKHDRDSISFFWDSTAESSADTFSK